MNIIKITTKTDMRLVVHDIKLAYHPPHKTHNVNFQSY